MGCDQTEQPLSGEKVIGPTVMIQSPSSTPTAGTPSQDAAKTHANPAIQVREDVAVAAVLEVTEPTTKRGV
jgi:hypothetical protein